MLCKFSCGNAVVHFCHTKARFDKARHQISARPHPLLSACQPGRPARYEVDAGVLPSGGGVRLRSLSAAAKAASARAASAVCIRERRQNAGRARRSAGRAGAGGPQGARRGDDAAQEGDAEVGSSSLDVLLHPVLVHDPARHQGRAGAPHHAPSASPPPPG